MAQNKAINDHVYYSVELDDGINSDDPDASFTTILNNIFINKALYNTSDQNDGKYNDDDDDDDDDDDENNIKISEIAFQLGTSNEISNNLPFANVY